MDLRADIVSQDNETGGSVPSGSDPAPAADEPKQKKRRRRRRRKKPPQQNQAAGTGVDASSPSSSNTSSSDSSSPEVPAISAADKNRPQQNSRSNGSQGSRASGKTRKPEVYAALDLGTNNCRLLVAKPDKNGFKVIDAFSRTVRLGAGLNGTGSLAQDSMDRAVDALKICAMKMRRRDVTRSRCIATEACRLADNGAEFIARVKAETGLEFEIISNGQEAQLAAAGCAPLLDHDSESALVFDIGGGSTELIWLDLNDQSSKSKKPQITAWTSLPFGVVTLAESYCMNIRDTAHEIEVFEQMTRIVRDKIIEFEGANHVRGSFDAGTAHLIGNSGTVTTLAAVHLGLERYDRNRVDGVWIDTLHMQDLISNLSTIGVAGRADHSCIGEDRADLLLPGCAIMSAITDIWPSQRMRVADRGLREGMLMDLIEKANRENKKRRRRRRRKSQTQKKSPNQSQVDDPQ